MEAYKGYVVLSDTKCSVQKKIYEILYVVNNVIINCS